MKTKNIKPLIEQVIQPFLDKLSKRDEVLGIVLLGGLGYRDFLDEYSDIDLSVFTTRKGKTKFPLPFEFHYKHKNLRLEFNIHQLVFEDEYEGEKWNTSKIEAYSKGKVIYDTENKITNLIKEKTVFDEEAAFYRLIWIIQQYKWRGQIHAIRAYKRGYPEASHDLLNNCSDLLVEAVYLLNKQYVPHKKWGFVFLDKLPNNYQLLEKFKKALLVKDYSLRDIKRRLKLLDEIYEIIIAKIYDKYPSFPLNPYEYYYRNFVQINKETSIDRAFSELVFDNNLTEEDKDEVFGNMCFNIIDSSET